MKVELPTLYSRDAKKNLIQWTVYTEGDVVVIEHGKVGGKMAVNKDRALPTNVGRSNERLGEAQAAFEAQAKWEKKIKQGYLESMDEAKTAEIILPMLAHPIVKKARRNGVIVESRRNIDFPCHVQPKLNGLRCLAIVGPDRSVTLKSRQGTVWDTLEHIEAAVAVLGEPGDIFDGELYLHGLPLQEHNSLVKNASDPEVAEKRKQLRYHIYDMPSKLGSRGRTWRERQADLRVRFVSSFTSGAHDEWTVDDGFLDFYPSTLVEVETHTAYNEADLDTFASKFIGRGFEGMIIRQLDHEYVFGKRKEALLKYKDFIDEEFVVEDLLSREYFPPDGSPTFRIVDKCVCRNNLSDATFEVVPLGTMEEKREMLKNKEQYIGKRLVVRFLERSNDGVPQGNTVGVAFRLDEDLPVEEEDPSIWT